MQKVLNWLEVIFYLLGVLFIILSFIKLIQADYPIIHFFDEWVIAIFHPKNLDSMYMLIWLILIGLGEIMGGINRKFYSTKSPTL